MVKSQQIRCIEFDGIGVLPDVVSIVNPAGEALEVARLDRFQNPDTEFGGRSHGFERDAFSVRQVFTPRMLLSLITKYYNASTRVLKHFSVSPNTICYTSGRQCP